MKSNPKLGENDSGLDVNSYFIKENYLLITEIKERNNSQERNAAVNPSFLLLIIFS